ncbi:hypothetical protein C8T65DRAFT_655950 [Cerioporus squamosus]|nr:hypothetical protein C8T65DRAFT_655950 [Cerioporus squamosus]
MLPLVRVASGVRPSCIMVHGLFPCGTLSKLLSRPPTAKRTRSRILSIQAPRLALNLLPLPFLKLTSHPKMTASDRYAPGYLPSPGFPDDTLNLTFSSVTTPSLRRRRGHRVRAPPTASHDRCRSSPRARATSTPTVAEGLSLSECQRARTSDWRPRFLLPNGVCERNIAAASWPCGFPGADVPLTTRVLHLLGRAGWTPLALVLDGFPAGPTRAATLSSSSGYLLHAGYILTVLCSPLVNLAGMGRDLSTIVPPMLNHSRTRPSVTSG